MFLWDAAGEVAGWVDEAGQWHDISEDESLRHTPKGTVIDTTVNWRRPTVVKAEDGETMDYEDEGEL